MSSTKVFAIEKDTVVRNEDDGSGGQGCGNSKHLYVGRYGGSGSSRNYDSLLKFTLDWGDVGRIVSATLNLYTDEYDTFGTAGEPGLMPAPTGSDKPKVTVYRLTSVFAEGSNVDGHFDGGDYTHPSKTTSGGVTKVLTPNGANLLHTIDITGIVRSWAPSTVESGGKKTNHGIGLYGSTSTTENWSGWAQEHSGGGGAAERPSITLVYELGPTVPNTPANLTPAGAVATLDTFEGDFSDVRPTDTLQSTSVEVYAADGVTRIASFSKVATESERAAGHFIIAADGRFSPKAGVTYKWRARYTDQEGEVSAWTALVTFSLTNTPPGDPRLSPINGSTYASLNLVKFRGGTFTDADGGNRLMAHQIQLSPFPVGDIRWVDEEDGVLWDTGKVYDALGSTSWTDYYGGRALSAGTYYWRARQWDQRDGVSDWVYARIVLSADFNPDPGSYDSVQIDPQAPWRILIRDLYQSDGVTKTAGRAPGRLVAVFEEAKNVGASIVFNSPGELHFTLLKDDPQISVVEPRQTHYAVEFYSGDGWQEKYAGVVWDADGTETDMVFKGIDYLALYDTVIDERYSPLKPNKTYKSGGSFYSNVTISTVVKDQLNRAKGLTDSWVGFISIGAIAAMEEKVSVYSTMQPVLSFVSGLLDSHRQGTGKRTRMKVVKTTTGGYQLQIVDNPGIIRSDLALYYGELVQGYRVIVFGEGWANVEHVVGRNRDGIKVVYQTVKGKPFQPSTSVYGRIATVAVMDGVQDQNDLTRRGLQAAIQSAKLGKNIAIGLRTEFLSPLQGWDLADVFPVLIRDGAIDTDRFGSGYWAAYAAAWEASDIGQQSLVITLLPREDAAAPDIDLIPSVPISTQPEWQLGWLPPDPLKASSRYYLDQKSGKVYVRNETRTLPVRTVTGTA